jgi:hypothetical protein
MSAELLPAEENEQGPAEETRTLSERDRYFAMRIALGDSIRRPVGRSASPIGTAGAWSSSPR